MVERERRGGGGEEHIRLVRCDGFTGIIAILLG